MKGVKAILAFVLGAAYASSWWGGAVFLPLPIIILPIVFSFALIVVCVSWLLDNWNE